MAARKVPDLFLSCGACGESVEMRSFLRLGDSHTDVCRARPILMRLDSTRDGSWMPLIQSPQNLTTPDRDRIRAEVAEMIAYFQRNKS